MTGATYVRDGAAKIEDYAFGFAEHTRGGCGPADYVRAGRTRRLLGPGFPRSRPCAGPEGSAEQLVPNHEQSPGPGRRWNQAEQLPRHALDPGPSSEEIAINCDEPVPG